MFYTHYPTFVEPCFAMPASRRTYSRPCSPCMPGAGLFLPLLVVLFLPALVRVAACVFFHALPILLVLGLSRAFCMTCDEFCDTTNKEACPCPTEKQACPCPAKKAESTVREALAKEKTVVKRDCSSVRLGTDANAITLTIAAPGVTPSDLEVSVVEHTLRIKGETKRGKEVFSIDRTLEAPSGVELEQAECSHADGVVTIVVPRKKSVKIAVTPLRVETVEKSVEKVHEEEEEEEVKAAKKAALKAMAKEAAEEKKVSFESSEDEWVEMPKHLPKKAAEDSSES